MNKPETLVDLLCARAHSAPDQPAYSFFGNADLDEELTVTYGELDKRARAVAFSISETVKAGQPAIILLPTGMDYIFALFGCLYAGVTAIPLYFRPVALADIEQGLSRLSDIASKTGGATVLTSPAIMDRLTPLAGGRATAEGCRWLVMDSTYDQADWQRPQHCPASTAVTLYEPFGPASSESLKITHQQLMKSLDEFKNSYERFVIECGVNFIPLDSYVGLMEGIMMPLYVGYRGILLHPVMVIQKPARWLRAISKFRATVSGAPSRIYKVTPGKTRADDLVELDLSGWKIAHAAGERISQEVVDDFAVTFQPCGFKRDAFEYDKYSSSMGEGPSALA